MAATADAARRDGYVGSADIPLLLTFSRLALVPLLIALAWRRAGALFCCALVAELGIDIADGLLARRLLHPAPLARQRRCDGAVDAVVYASVPLCLWRFRPGLPRAQAAPLLLLLGVHLVDLATGVAKFHRLPRYRTRSFKTSAGALGLAIPSLFIWGDRAQPFQFALWAATAAHIENVLITRALPHWHSPVLALAYARALRTRTGMDETGGPCR